MIFTILKVIGIILLVVLALILTALLCVLFVPVKYRAVGSFDNTDIRAKAHVSWLFHLFALHIEYAQETDGYIRLAFVKKKLFDNYEALDYKFIGLSHNTVRCAAGGAVLCAEALTAKGYIQAK